MDAERKREYRKRTPLSNLVLMAVVLLSLFLSGCSVATQALGQDDTRVIRIATDYQEEHLGYQQLQLFAQAVAEKSDGALMVKLYRSGEWSNAESFTAYLDIGSLEMVCLPLEQAVIMQPMYALYEQPYLFSSLQMVENYVTGPAVQTAMNQLPEQYHGLGLVADGYYYFVPQKITAMLAYGDVKRLARTHELVDMAVYDTQAVYSVQLLIASQEWWGTLSEQEQLWIAESFQDSLNRSFVYQEEMATLRLAESGAELQVLPVELNGYMEQWVNQRELYFSTHNDVLTAYWRPTVATQVIGKEI